MYVLKPDKDALKIYFDEYEEWFKFLEIDWSYERFAEWAKNFDIYGLYCDNDLKGCIFFEKNDIGFVFHVAMLPEIRGKWSFYWKDIKKWMLEKYSSVYGVAHVSDRANNKILPRAGFELIKTDNDWKWYRLWRQAQQ